MSGLYYLQNITAGYVGNAPVFWRAGGSGYTDNIDDAEKFTARKANAIIRSTRGSHKWTKWPIEVIDRLAYRVVDMQALRKIGK
jgi:hypothetical protein